MGTRVGRRGLCLALALAMALSALLSPVGHSASHDPALVLAEIERHTAEAAEDEDHGHDHGWRWAAEGAPAQGHNPADHDHVTQAAADPQGFSFLRTCDSWDAPPPRSCDHGPCFCIDRPPRA